MGGFYVYYDHFRSSPLTPKSLNSKNLVIDTTPISEDTTISGNNVGKTTFIRSVDFCFGSTGKDIYVDKENKSDNTVVKDFLFENEVSFTLSLLNIAGKRMTLKRSFNSADDLYINDEKYDSIVKTAAPRLKQTIKYFIELGRR